MHDTASKPAPQTNIRPIAPALDLDPLSPRLLTGLFPAHLCDHIAAARSEILIATFQFTDPWKPARSDTPHPIHYLIDAARRGVAVTIAVCTAAGREHFAPLSSTWCTRLREAGAALVVPYPGRLMHAKLAIIDRRHLYCGSHNLSHAGMLRNIEATIYIHNPALADHARALFRSLHPRSNVSA